MDQVEEMDHRTAAATGAPPQTISGGKLWAFRFVAATLALCFAFGVVEATVRILLAAKPDDIETLRRFEGRKREGGPMTLINFVHISANPRLVYELIPTIEGVFVRQPVKFNSAGFFDRERAIPKPQGVWRLAVIGDSVVFGWGAPQSVRLTDVLERFLNDTATSGGTRFEVLNFGVPGYNTVMECEMLRNRVAPFDPDAVALVFVLDNDASVPNFVSRPRKLLTLRHSFALEMALKRARTTSTLELEPGLAGVDPANFPPEYGFLLGWANAYAALAEIRAFCRDRKLPCLFDVDYWDAEPYRGPSPRAPDAGPAAEVSAKAVALGFIAANPLHEILAFLNRTGYHSYALCVDPDHGDAHPNAIRHAIHAKTIYKALVESGSLPDADARKRTLERDLDAWDSLIGQADATTSISEKWKKQLPGGGRGSAI